MLMNVKLMRNFHLVEMFKRDLYFKFEKVIYFMRDTGIGGRYGTTEFSANKGIQAKSKNERKCKNVRMKPKN